MWNILNVSFGFTSYNFDVKHVIHLLIKQNMTRIRKNMPTMTMMIDQKVFRIYIFLIVIS